MNIFQVVILAVSSNLDDLGIGFSLGLKGDVPKHTMLVIAFLSFVSMGLGLTAGERTAQFLSTRLSVYISTFVFILFGIWFIWQGIKKSKEHGKLKKAGDMRQQNEPVAKENMIGWKGSLLLGLALGIDSLSLGFSGGLAGYPVLLTGLLAGISSLLFVWSGSRFGTKVSIGFIRDWADYISGGLLFLLAFVHLVQAA